MWATWRSKASRRAWARQLMPAMPAPYPPRVPKAKRAIRMRRRMVVLLVEGPGSHVGAGPEGAAAEEAGAGLDHLGDAGALLLVQGVVHLRERADRGLAQLLERGVVPREHLAEEDLVHGGRAHGLREVGPRRLRLAARLAPRGAQLVDGLADHLLLPRRRVEPPEERAEEDRGPAEAALVVLVAVPPAVAPPAPPAAAPPPPAAPAAVAVAPAPSTGTSAQGLDEADEADGSDEKSQHGDHPPGALLAASHDGEDARALSRDDGEGREERLRGPPACGPRRPIDPAQWRCGSLAVTPAMTARS